MTTVTYNNHKIDLDAARILMDDELCDEIHGIAKNEQEFFDMYLNAHRLKYNQEFIFA